MDSQWLKMQFQHNPKRTKAGLAKALGLEPPAISKILKGDRQIKAQEYLAMRNYFGLPNERDRYEGQKKDAYKLEPLQKEGSLSDSDTLPTAEWIIPADILSTRTNAQPDQIKVFRIQENMMEPELERGDYVLVDLSDTKPTPPGSFIISDGFGNMARLCEYIPKSTPPQIRVSARKGDFLPHILKERDFLIIGRIIAKLQML